MNVAFPDIRKDFGAASLSGISWVLNAYNIVFAAFIVAAGRIADLLGRCCWAAWTPPRRRALTRMVITPQNDGVGMLEFHQLDRMRNAGRRAAREALERAPVALLG